MNERLKVFININNKIPLKSDTSFAAQYCIRCSTYGKQSVYSQISNYISHVSLLFVDTRYHRDFTGASYFFCYIYNLRHSVPDFFGELENIFFMFRRIECAQKNKNSFGVR